MYHFGLTVGDSDDELREVVRHLAEHGLQIQGASDHTVTHSLYIADPDGHEIELHVDVLPAQEWLADPSLDFAPIRSLRLRSAQPERERQRRAGAGLGVARRGSSGYGSAISSAAASSRRPGATTAATTAPTASAAAATSTAVW